MCFVYRFMSLKLSLRNQIEEFLEIVEQKTLHRCILWMRPHVPGDEHGNFWSHCYDAAAGSTSLAQGLMHELLTVEPTQEERGSLCQEKLELGPIP